MNNIMRGFGGSFIKITTAAAKISKFLILFSAARWSRISEIAFKEYAQSNLEVRLYLLAIYFMLAGMSAHLLGQKVWVEETMMLGIVSAALGFLSWTMPWISEAWKKPVMRNSAWLVHLGVLLISAAIGRGLMTKFTGLPGQDFPLAVGFLSLLMYPVVWMLIAVIIIGATSLVLEVWILLQAGMVALLQPFKLIFTKKMHVRDEANETLWLGRFLGSLSLFLALSTLASISSVILPKVEVASLWLAYLGDYQMIDKYPGIDIGSKVVLHENGVYSIATADGGRVIISVGTWSPPK
ncbi:hypothetical protein [Xanthomonas campestris]|uniref:hypothetical protein n=1 Tax=Xanthomonas campestris TaxID=339 RepID=UPI001E3CFA8E|nr:hypothetical protein [Xanthomonas campestris]MCC5074672.1 hypothetical protein [Xanthomonas campestris pv. plantaginis]